MKRLPFKRPGSAPRNAPPKAGKIDDHPEAEALMRNLDKVYERLRRRARAEWLRSHSGADPSDACVSVRITSGDGTEIALSGKGRRPKP